MVGLQAPRKTNRRQLGIALPNSSASPAEAQAACMARTTLFPAGTAGTLEGCRGINPVNNGGSPQGRRGLLPSWKAASPQERAAPRARSYARRWRPRAHRFMKSQRAPGRLSVPGSPANGAGPTSFHRTTSPGPVGVPRAPTANAFGLQSLTTSPALSLRAVPPADGTGLPAFDRGASLGPVGVPRAHSVNPLAPQSLADLALPEGSPPDMQAGADGDNRLMVLAEAVAALADQEAMGEADPLASDGEGGELEGPCGARGPCDGGAACHSGATATVLRPRDVRASLPLLASTLFPT
jgi:hypothetical protein